MKARWMWACLAGALLIAVSLFFYCGTRFGNIDDAIIVIVYARHLLESGTFYWNASDGALDGFTSLLDVLVKAAGILVAPGDPVFMAWLTTLLFYLAVVLAVFLIALSLSETGSPRARLLLAFLGGLTVATSPSLAVGSSLLLETPLYVFTVLAAIACLLGTSNTSWKMPVVFTLLLIAVSLSRYEGIPIALVLLSFHAKARVGKAHDSRRGRLLPFLPIVSYLVAMAGYFAWRIGTFGYWAPNTYYAKTSDSRLNEISDGAAYVLTFVQQHAVVGYLTAAALLLAPGLLLVPDWRSRSAREHFGMVTALSVLSLGTVIWAGGDSYDVGRFLALPITLAVLALIMASLSLSGRIRYLPMTLLVLLALGQLHPTHAEYQKRLRIVQTRPPGEATLRPYRLVVETISGILGQDGEVAHQNLQMFKYFSDGTTVIDMTGLNTRWIAHLPEPDHVIWGKSPPGGILDLDSAVWIHGYKLWNRTPMARYTTEQLLTDYERSSEQLAAAFLGNPIEEDVSGLYFPASIRVRDWYFNFLVRRDWVERFQAAGVMVNAG